MLRLSVPLVAVALVLAGIPLPQPAAAQDGSYDMDCAVILCMAGGFPPVEECRRAYDYMIGRITHLPPKPPFGVCAMADGTGYDGYDLDYEIGLPTAKDAYSCPIGSMLYLRHGESETAFCYRSVVKVARDGECRRVYRDITPATFRQLRAALTIEPGTASEYVAPPVLIEQLVPAPASFDESCEVAPIVAVDGDAIAPPLSSSCLSQLAAPSTAAICNGKWGVVEAIGGNPAHADRASCARTIGGDTVLAVTAHKGEANSLIQANVPVPGARGYNSVRASVEFMLPKDFEAWDGGRLAFGILIGEASCASGGCAPRNQKGAMIRAQFKEATNGSIKLQNYSYHLDRGSKSQVVSSPWQGQGTQSATWGAGEDMATPIPRGEWITLTLDVTLNDPGRANGRSVLSAFDGSGQLIGAAAFDGVTYRPDSSWTFNGLVMTEKYTHVDTQRPTRTQSMFYRNYKLLSGDAAGAGCAG